MVCCGGDRGGLLQTDPSRSLRSGQAHRQGRRKCEVAGEADTKASEAGAQTRSMGREEKWASWVGQKVCFVFSIKQKTHFPLHELLS